MAQQTEELRTNVRWLTLNATTSNSSVSFFQRARTLTITTEDDVWINFDTPATTSAPSIFLKNGLTLNIKDVNYKKMHAITSSGSTTINVTYQYI